MIFLEQTIKKNGFGSMSEFTNMVSSVDLSKPGMIAKFKDWQENDATKEGLQNLLGENDGN